MGYRIKMSGSDIEITADTAAEVVALIPQLRALQARLATVEADEQALARALMDDAAKASGTKAQARERGPHGERRPADAVGCAVHVAQIATREREDTRESPKAPSPQHKGGKARAARLSPERRSEIARKAAQTRWAKDKTGERR